jgi:galactokinase
MNSTIVENIKVTYGNTYTASIIQEKRCKKLLTLYAKLFGSNAAHIVSTPGRTELAGNHTDHNNGKVIAAGINLDTIGVASRSSNSKATVYTYEFKRYIEVDVNDLIIRPEEVGTTEALLRGVIKGMKNWGYSVGGFTCVLQSDISIGAGLSSSASIEVLFGTIFNVLYNNGQIEPLTLAKIGHYAENVYFGKPCGMMDQIACAFGGIVGIDFEDQDNPIIERVRVDILNHRYNLLIIDTGGNHIDLTSEYAAIKCEMMSVANAVGKNNCRELTMKNLMATIPRIRGILGERAILRAMHFIEENDRTDYQLECLQKGIIEEFLEYVNASGHSSIKLLQNIYSSKDSTKQPIMLALALTENYVTKIGQGAVRIHGGGFAGSIQVYMPTAHLADYKNMIESIYGRNSLYRIYIRPIGTTVLL